MKHLKKLTSLLVAMLMVLGMASTAFAIDGGSITIDNAVEGQTYSIYEILSLESYNAGSNAYTYKATTDWNAFINSNGIKETYVNVDGQGYVTWVEGADAAAFAKAALAYAKANNIQPSATPIMADSATVKFEGLNLGYYLVDSSLGALCSLDTTNPNATIKEKNAQPTIDKTVEEDSTGNYGDTNDADIGQTVNFKTTVHAKPGAWNYVVHDEMSAGLTFGSVTKINDGTRDLVADTDYNVETTNLDAGCTFHVVFTESYLNSITANTDIVIEYTATLNENAVIAGNGNPNETWLDYGDNSHTEHDTTITYTWKLPIFKYTGTEKTPLAGAEFVLYKTESNKTLYAQVDTNNKLTGWTENKEDATTLISDEDGYINVEGLDADTYYLEETKAPDGYNKLAAPVTVVIDNSGKINATTDHTDGVAQVEVENKSGTELPSTGGMGTKVFYVLGAVLMLGAGVLLITKRRMSKR